ncbi:MAG: cupin domain-containing protein [Rhizobium sp.]
MNRETEPRIPRRVVTGIENGKSVFVSDGPTPNAHAYHSIPGHLTSVLYATPAQPGLPQDHAERAPPQIPITLEPGETKLMIVVFPPDSVFAAVDPVSAVEEQAIHIPGLIEAFEPDAPGMHTTNTVDYDIVVDGEIWLELDDGAETLLKQGDVVVQCGTRHAWRNRSDKPATLCFVLIGAERRS